MTATPALTPTNVSDATFRAWGLGISTQFAAMGLVQTADTGQINWVTVLTPAGANAAQGYEIWRFADALQATAPIFIKVEYGSGNAAANPAIYFTFGTGSNGAGTLTGPISLRQQTYSTAYATNPLTCYISGNTNYITMALFVQGVGASANISAFFSIERTKDAAGNDTNQGLLILWKKDNANAYGQLFWDRTIGTPVGGSENSMGAMSNSGTTGKNGVQVAVYPFFLNNAGIFVSPPLGAMAYVNADILAFGAVTFVIYGANHTYMPIGSTALTAGSLLGRTLGTPTLMTRFE